MKLGNFFSLEEMCATSTGLANEPDTQHVVNLTRLVCLILDPIRAGLGVMHVTSGFRSVEVNAAVGGADNSYHLYGRAADIVPADAEIEEIAALARTQDLPFDKLIMEDNGSSRWVHIQMRPAGEENRGIVMRSYMQGGSMVYETVEQG